MPKFGGNSSVFITTLQLTLKVEFSHQNCRTRPPCSSSNAPGLIMGWVMTAPPAVRYREWRSKTSFSVYFYVCVNMCTCVWISLQSSAVPSSFFVVASLAKFLFCSIIQNFVKTGKAKFRWIQQIVFGLTSLSVMYNVSLMSILLSEE